MSTDLPSSEADFCADAHDHQASSSSNPTERRRFAFALIAAAVLHLLIPLAVIIVYVLWPPKPAMPEQEIPVEIVQEEPPPKPDPPQEKPKPPPEPDDERPAYDAPRAATPEQANRESPDQKTQAPVARSEEPKAPGAPQESHAQAAAREQQAEASPRQQATPSPDADQTASPTPATTDADASPPAAEVEPKPSPTPAPKADAPPGAPLPSADELPAYKFAAAATQSPIVGGSADTRYFTIVYGMIMSHLMQSPRPQQAALRGGAVVFTVDETGNLVQRKLMNSSGSPSLDLAVMNAIAAASPYPAPPGWQARSMRLVYGK